jgi:hypothetical protein
MPGVGPIAAAGTHGSSSSAVPHAYVRIGEISRGLETAPHGPGRGKSLPTNGKPFKAATLKAAGISTSAAHRAEQLAENPWGGLPVSKCRAFGPHATALR